MCDVRKRLAKAMFFLLVSIIGFYHVKNIQAATTDFSQSSISTGYFLLGANFLALIPDPDVDYSSVVAFTTYTSSSDQDFALTNLIRRNPTSATLTDTLLAVIDINDPDSTPLPTIPLASNSNFTLNLLGVATNAIQFYVTPSSDLIFPFGTAFTSQPINLDTTTLLTLDDANFVENLIDGNINNSPFYIRFYQSLQSFPTVTNGLPATVFASEVPVESSSPDGERYVAYYIATMDSNGNPTSPTGVVNTLLNVGTPIASGRNAANETPYLSDLNGDGILDLTLLVNRNADEVLSFIMIALGNGDGTFGTFTIHTIENKFVFGVTSGDIDGNGNIDLVISSWVPTQINNQAPTNPVIQTITNPLSDFTINTALELDSSNLSTFIHNLDCNVDGSPDIVSVELEIATNENNEFTGIETGNVMCYLNNGNGGFNTSSSLNIYPKELLQVHVETNNGTESLDSAILQSQVGDIGCGKGWFGNIFYALGTDGQTVQGFNSVLFSQHSDCTSVINALSGGTGLEVSGGGCALSKSNMPPLPSTLLTLITLSFIAGAVFMRFKNNRS